MDIAMEKYLGVEAFVEVLTSNGVDNIFFNPGVDTVPVQVAVSRLKASGKRVPRLILCLDESVAMSAAHGHYMVSGQPQVVMVHSELGTMQVGGALHNAQWGRVPVILWAGLSPHTRRVDWLQKPFYQGLTVRNCVKWDHELRNNENIHDILRQAFKTALDEPRGPVYLSYPREILNEEIDKLAIVPVDRNTVSSALMPVDEDLSKIAKILVEAENPLILAGYSGRHLESVASLVKLAETLCAPVITGSTRVNFPTDHPLCVGFEQIAGRRKENSYAVNVDVLLVIDYDMPYVSGGGIAGPDTKIIYIDVDPLTQGRPLWGRDVDLFIKADSRVTIPALEKISRLILTSEKRTRLRERLRWLEIEHNEQRTKRTTLARSKENHSPISPDWLCHCIAEVIDEDTIIVNQTISQSAVVAEQIDRTKPGSLLACAGGSIQWALGASLGAKLAAPDRTVVSLVTDGGFIWGCPVATLWSASSFNAPFLAIIFNNQSYGAIRRLAQGAYGEYALSDEMAFELGVDINPPPDYAAVAEACGAYGRTVDDPADVLLVLNEAVKEVRSGKTAVVDVRLER